MNGSALPLEPGSLRDAFVALEGAGIRYVVLRGYLPQSELLHSADIDVFIDPAQLVRAEALLREHGWLRRAAQFGRFPHVFFDHLHYRARFVTVFDVVHGLYYGADAHELRAAALVLDRSVLAGEVRVPHPWHALFLLVLHLSLDKDELAPHHYSRLAQHGALCGADPDGRGVLERDFGADAAALAVEFAQRVTAADTSALPALRARAAALSCLRSHRLAARARALAMRLRKRFGRPARIAVLGIDGAGKSTLISGFVQQTTGLPTGSAYLGYNAFHTRWFRWMLQRLEQLQSDAGTRDGAQMRLLDALRALLFPLEIRARMRKAEWGRSLVLYDRHPVSFAPLSPPRSLQARVLARLMGVAGKLVPRPDFVIFLDGDAHTLWERKKEYPLEQFIAAQQGYRSAFRALDIEGSEIRTDQQSIAQALDAIRTALSGSPAVIRVLYRA